MSMSAETLFGCAALASDLPCGPVLLEETLAFISNSKEQHGSPSLEVPTRHCKDPFLPWGTHVQLTRQWQEIVTSLTVMDMPSTSSSSTFTHPIHWRPLEDDISLVELFAGIGIGLATVLEVGLKVRRYIHIDTGVVPNRATRHHLQRL